jgi:DNA-binding IclR family transcriptional regulator
MSSDEERHWRFLTNHAQVLLCIARDGDARMRDIAQMVGITERAAQRIVSDLIHAKYVSRERLGRRNHYKVDPEAPMRHHAQDGHEVGELLRLFERPGPTAPEPTRHLR